MASLLGFVKGVGVGVTAAYFCDPVRGKLRRAQLRDQALDWVSQLERETRCGWRDLANRSKSFVDQTQSQLIGDAEAESELASGIRSRIGHYISRPDLVHVAVHGTRAKLTGKVLATEIQDLMLTK